MWRGFKAFTAKVGTLSNRPLTFMNPIPQPVDRLFANLRLINNALYGYRRGNRKRKGAEALKLSQLLGQTKALLDSEAVAFADLFQAVNADIRLLKPADPMQVIQIEAEESDLLKDLGFSGVKRSLFRKIYRQQIIDREAFRVPDQVEQSFASPDQFYRYLEQYVQAELQKFDASKNFPKKKKNKRRTFLTQPFYLIAGSVLAIANRFALDPFTQMLSTSIGVAFVQKGLD